jgi:hypothetical protein
VQHLLHVRVIHEVGDVGVVWQVEGACVVHVGVSTCSQNVLEHHAVGQKASLPEHTVQCSAVQCSVYIHYVCITWDIRSTLDIVFSSTRSSK